MKRTHPEKDPCGMLECVFVEDSSPVGESNYRRDDEISNYTKNDGNDESPTTSFIEDVSDFFNISKSNSNESYNDDFSAWDSEDQMNEKDSVITLKSYHNRSIAEEIKQMKKDFSMNNNSCAIGKFNSSSQLNETPSICKRETISQKESSTDFSQSPGNNEFLKEVKRVLYEVKSCDFPDKNTKDYYNVAQEYAIYGNGFLDFVKDLAALCKEIKANENSVSQQEIQTSSSEDEIVQPRDYPYHPRDTKVEENTNNIESSSNDFQNSNNNNPNNNRPQFSERQAINNSQLSLAAATSAATAATYYQLCSNLQPSLRPVAVVNSTTSAAAASVASPGYVLLSNRVTYLAHGTHNMTPQQVFFNQQQLSTTTNFFANQAAIGSPPNIRFPNPVVATTTTTQHISNTVYKETQYVANVPVANSAGPSNVNAYERLVNAQLVRQVLQTRQQQQQQQQQQQALIAAAIYQQQLQRQQHQIRMANSLQNTVMNSVSSTVNSNVNTNIDRNITNVVGQSGVETTCTMLQMQSVDVARVNFNSDPGLVNFPETNNNNFKSSHQG